MDKKYFYWIIGLVAIYFLFIKKKSQFGRSFPDFSKMSEEDKDKYRKNFGFDEKTRNDLKVKNEENYNKIKSQIESICKSSGGTYVPLVQGSGALLLGYCKKEIDVKSSFGKSEAQRQRNKDYKAQREAEIKQEKMNKEILNAKEQELSKIKPQIENVLKSIGLKYSPSLQYVIDHNLINLGYGV